MSAKVLSLILGKILQYYKLQYYSITYITVLQGGLGVWGSEKRLLQYTLPERIFCSESARCHTSVLSRANIFLYWQLSKILQNIENLANQYEKILQAQLANTTKYCKLN